MRLPERRHVVRQHNSAANFGERQTRRFLGWRAAGDQFAVVVVEMLRELITISASRVGARRSADNRVRTSRAQVALRDAAFFGNEGSGIVVSGHPPHGFDECGPRLLLLCQ